MKVVEWMQVAEMKETRVPARRTEEKYSMGESIRRKIMEAQTNLTNCERNGEEEEQWQ